jgi:hypothetical protein
VRLEDLQELLLLNPVLRALTPLLPRPTSVTYHVRP